MSTRNGLEGMLKLVNDQTIRMLHSVTKQIKSNSNSNSNTKKALVIGIQYVTGDNRLSGSFCDALNFSNLICMAKYGYDVIFMTDHRSSNYDNPLLVPTRDNLIREIRSLMKDVRKGDHRLLYFAGHCGQIPVDPGTNESNEIPEEDNMNEYIVCADENEKGTILDDDLRKLLVIPSREAKSGLVAIFDACHSATLLDLPHHRCNRVRKPLTYTRRFARRAVELLPTPLIAQDSIVMGLLEEWTRSRRTSPDGIKPPIFCHGVCPRIRNRRQLIFCLSACKDSQQAIDTTEGRQSMTSGLISILEKNPKPRIRDLMKELWSWSQNVHFNGNTPEPQLSTDHPARMDSFFIL